MRRLVIRLSMVLLVVSFAFGAVDSHAESLYTDTEPAAAIILRAGEETVTFENDVAITSFTATVTQNGNTETILISDIEYELLDTGGAFLVYRVSDCTMVNSNAQPPLQGPFPLIYEGGIAHTGNVIYNVVLGVIPAEAPINYLNPHTELIIGVVLPHAFPLGTVDREIEISDVVISDLVTGEVIATLGEVEMGIDNKVILEKLDDIDENITQNKRLLRNIRNFVVRIYYLVKRYLFANR